MGGLAGLFLVCAVPEAGGRHPGPPRSPSGSVAPGINHQVLVGWAGLRSWPGPPAPALSLPSLPGNPVPCNAGPPQESGPQHPPTAPVVLSSWPPPACKWAVLISISIFQNLNEVSYFLLSRLFLLCTNTSLIPLYLRGL